MAVLPPSPSSDEAAVTATAPATAGTPAPGTPPDDATVLRPGRPTTGEPVTSSSTSSPVTEPPGSRRDDATRVQPEPEHAGSRGHRGLMALALVFIAVLGAAGWWFWQSSLAVNEQRVAPAAPEPEPAVPRPDPTNRTTPSLLEQTSVDDTKQREDQRKLNEANKD